MKKIIHYCWFGPKPLPKLAKKCIDSWKKIYPDYEIKKWSEENVDLEECDFIKEAYKEKKWAFVADYTRAKVLYEYGGIYMDTDMELTKSVDNLMTEDFVIGVEDSGCVAAGIIIVKNRHNKYIKKLLDTYKSMKFSNTDDLFTISIPKILTNIFEKEIDLSNTDKINKIDKELAIYPREYFYPLSYDRKNNLFTDNTYGIHYYDASWISPTSKIALWMNRHNMEKLVRFMYSFMNLFKNKNNLLIAIILSLLFTFSICNFSKYEQTKVKLTSLNKKNEKSTGYNVEVSNIKSKLTDNSYKIKKITKGWYLWRSKLKNNTDKKSTIELILPPAKELEIEFVKTRDSGKVLLEYNNTKKGIDLYNKKWNDGLYGEQVYTYKINSKINNFLSISNILDILFVFIIFVILNLIWLKIFEKNKKGIMIPLILIFFTLFTNIGLYKIIYFDFISLIILFIMTIIIGNTISKIDDNIINNYFKSKFNKIIFIIISFINSFIFGGYQLFLSGNFINFNIMILSKYILLTILIISFELFIIYIYETYNQKITHNLNKNDYLKKYLIFFSIFFIIWMISLIAHYPVNMTSDTADQWAQALGLRDITTAHPAFISIYYRILHNIGFGVFEIGILQVFIFSSILAYIFTYFYKKGINFIFLIIFTFLISILPSSYMLITTLWKDVPYTLFLLLVSFYTYRLIIEKEKFLTIKNIIFFSISIVITYLTRHNGIGPFVFMIILLIIYSFNLKSFKPISIIIISILLIKLVNGPIFNYFEVDKKINKKSDSTFVNTIYRSTGAILKKGGTVKKEYLDIVETNMSKKIMINYFDPFNGDTYGFTSEVQDYLNNHSNEPIITTKNVLEIYLWELIHYPNIVIKERLDATSLFWSSFMPDGSFNHKYADGVYFPDSLDGNIVGVKLNENYSYSTQNIIVKGLRFINKIVENIKIFDAFVWRSGFSLIMLFIITFILIAKNNSKFLLAFLPLLGNMGTWVLLMSHQSFRYVWYINVILYLFILILITNGREFRDEKKN